MVADIRDADHVARYCSPRKLEEDGTPAPNAFRLRDRDGCCLSVNWLECFKGQSVDDNIPHIRSELRQHYEPKKNGWLAVLNVGEAKHVIKTSHGVEIHVRRDRPNDYPSHACVGGYSTNDNEVATALSEMVGKNNMHRAVLEDEHGA